MSHKVFHSDSESEPELKEEEDTAVGERLLADSESESEQSEDDAPEDVGFGESKKSVLEKVNDALSQIKDDKEKVKLKRKQRDENFKLQKKKKLEELQSKKLPAEILESLSSKSLKEKKKTEEEEGKEEGKAEEVGDRLEASEDEGIFDDEDYEGDEEDFIPLDQNAGIEVLTVQDSKKKLLSSGEMAAEFRHKRIYGKGIHRKPASSLIAQKRKRKAQFM